jgi:hypothetical protein
MKKDTGVSLTFDPVREEMSLEEKIRGSSDWIFEISLIRT